MVNATLVVQAFNFFVAYLLLRFLLFKPAVRALNQERDEKEHLESLATQREQGLVETAEGKERAWQEFQQQFAQAFPPTRGARVVHPDVEPAQEAELPRENELNKLAQDLQEAIVKKVQHVK